MTLEEFINDFDIENAVILFGGKRKVLPEDIDKLIRLGEILARKTTKMRFRSGNADGADYHFIGTPKNWTVDLVRKKD